MKTCPRCKTDFEVDNFYRNSRAKDGLDCWCKKCRTAANKKTSDSYESGALAVVPVTEKFCSGCSTTKSVSEFHKCRSSKSGLLGSCKSCQSRYQKERRARDPEKYAAISRAASAKRRALAKENDPIKNELCSYCLAPATEWDHVRPLSKGGADAPSNIVPACMACNRSKNDTDLLQFLMQRSA